MMPYMPYYYGAPYAGQPATDPMNPMRTQQPYPQPVPMQPQGQAPSQPQASASSGINWVQGEEGARAYMVAPGNSVLLMDSEADQFYIKTVDASGMPQPLRIFRYTEQTGQNMPKSPVQASPQPGQEYVTRQEFNALSARLEALMPERKTTRKTMKEEAENA